MTNEEKLNRIKESPLHKILKKIKDAKDRREKEREHEKIIDNIEKAIDR
jgi:hypothetical protein